MYLTAQRVRSKAYGTGINTFLYLHGHSNLSELDFDEVVEHPPKNEVARSITVPPGGNTVDSYLDLIAPDGVSEERLVNFVAKWAQDLDAFQKPRQPVRREKTRRDKDITAQFNWSSRVPRLASVELQELGERAIAIVREFRDGEGRKQKPLTIELVRTADGIQLRLDQASVRRLERRMGRELFSAVLTVDDDTLQAFLQLHGAFLPQAVQLLAVVEPSELADMGGVRVVDSETGERWNFFGASS